jgi:hypothetical protein
MTRTATNEERVKWAEEALYAFMSATGDHDGYGDAITDLLADLMHMCAAQGTSFDQHVLMAEMHFESETEEG